MYYFLTKMFLNKFLEKRDKQYWIGAAISAAGGLIGGLLQGHQQGYLNRKQVGYNKQLMDYQADVNQRLINAQNEYNDPQSQISRLSRAGLNPNLVYGNGSMVNSQSNAGSVGLVSAPDLSGENKYAAINSALTAAQIGANIELTKAQTQKVQSETSGQDITNNTNQINLDYMNASYKGEVAQRAVQSLYNETTAQFKRSFLGNTEYFAKLEKITLEQTLSVPMLNIDKLYNEVTLGDLSVNITAQDAMFKDAQVKDQLDINNVHIKTSAITGFMQTMNVPYAVANAWFTYHGMGSADTAKLMSHYGGNSSSSASSGSSSASSNGSVGSNVVTGSQSSGNNSNTAYGAGLTVGASYEGGASLLGPSVKAGVNGNGNLHFDRNTGLFTNQSSGTQSTNTQQHNTDYVSNSSYTRSDSHFTSMDEAKYKEFLEVTGNWSDVEKQAWNTVQIGLEAFGPLLNRAATQVGNRLVDIDRIINKHNKR